MSLAQRLLNVCDEHLSPITAEIVQKIEQTGTKLSPVGLVISGLVLVLTGLFFWLGGLPFKKISIVVLGVFCGLFSGFFVFNQDVIITLALAAAAVILLAVMDKIFAVMFNKISVLWYLVSAFFWAFLGTALIFAGMIYLLLYKGSKPADSIIGRPIFYIIVFAAMAAFGTVEQFILYRKPAKKADPKKNKEN